LVALAYPFIGFRIVHQLTATGQLGQARKILALLIEAPGSLLSLQNLSYVHFSLRLVQQHEAALLADAAHTLTDSDNRLHLVECALLTPLSDLRNFLAYAEKTAALKTVFEALTKEIGKGEYRTRLVERTLLTPLGNLRTFLAYAEKTAALKTVFEALTKEIGKGEHRTRLVERALLTPLDHLQTFLAYAEKTAALKTVFKALTKEIGKGEYRTRLVERTLLTPLGNLRTFLAYAEKTAALKTVFEALTKEFGKEEYRTRLVEHALITPLHFLRTFLAYAEKTAALKTVFEALTKEFGKGEYRTRLVERALLTPLGDLQTFLAYAEKTAALKTVFKALTKEFGKGENRDRLVRTFTASPIDQIVNILSSETLSDFWDAILRDVNEEEWEDIRLKGVPPQVDAFIKFQQLMTIKGRPELASAPALAIVREADVKEWHRSGVGIHSLSHVLRCATKATSEEIHLLLEHVTIADCFGKGIEWKAKTGGLAGSLLALSITLPPDLRGALPCLRLRKRLIKDITMLHAESGEWVEALSLLGAAAALRLRLDATTKVHWPSAEDITSIIEQRIPAPNWIIIGPLQAQLWFGMREMARLRNDHVSVPAEHGDKILTLWRNTNESEKGNTLPAHVREANAHMIIWLEQCKKEGWCLVRDAER